jgi:hypothetical protein
MFSKERQQGLLNDLAMQGYGFTPQKDGQIIPADKPFRQLQEAPGRSLTSMLFKESVMESAAQQNQNQNRTQEVFASM